MTPTDSLATLIAALRRVHHASFDDVLVDALRVARETRNPLIVAYVDAAGRPSQAPRGTVQTFSSTQLALWAHNPSGGLATAVRANPNVSLHFWGGMGTQYGG